MSIGTFLFVLIALVLLFGFLIGFIAAKKDE